MRVRVPGDKSLSQRALIFAALADGESSISGLLHGGDSESTAGALRRLGVDIPELPADGGAIRIRGVGLRGLRTPDGPLDLGNSGTGARLLSGVLAGSGLSATLDGDASLRARPMRRITDPLGLMGARFEHGAREGRLPMTVRGRHPLSPIEWESPVASAQVKSAILLAGVTGGAFVIVSEPRQSRDHTERMLSAVGAPVIAHEREGRWQVELRAPPARLHPLEFAVPGDPSSAAFLLALGALGGAGSELTVEGVGLNPTRIACFDVLRRMGADIEVVDRSEAGAAEPVGDVTVRPGPLRATSVGPEEVPALIDELPLIAVVGACAEGETEIRGAEELRAKESDRIRAVCSNLSALGAPVEEHPDGLVVRGRPGARWSGRMAAHHDHRIAMAFAVLGAAHGGGVTVDDPAVAAVSFPGFHDLLRRVAAK